MSPSRSGRQSFRRALALSVALHVCVALFVVTGTLPLGSGTVQSGGHAFETTRISYLTIERRARRRPTHPATMKPARAKAVPIAAVSPRRKRSTPTTAAVASSGAAAVVSRSPEPSQRLALPLALATPRPERQLANNTAPKTTPSLATPSMTPSAPPVPSPAPATTPSPQPADAGANQQIAARGLDVPPGGWGQSFERPLVADEAALETLRSRYHSSTAVRVEVDDAGHATHVSLPAGLPDDVRAELERRLLEMRYVPAECNGLRCTGSLQIVL